MPQLSADVAALLALGVADIPGTYLVGLSANRAAPVLLPADLYGTVAQYGAAAAAVGGNLQQVLDAAPAGSVVTLPPGVYDLPAPLFPGDRVLVGAGRVETVLRHAATPVVTGWLRGLVSDAHFVTTPTGFRTMADAALHARGTPWDLGPPAGWESLATFTLSVAGYRPGGWVPGNFASVCGIQAGDAVIGTLKPAPFVLDLAGTAGSPLLALRLRTADGTVRSFTVPIAVNLVNLDCVWAVNLAAGTVACTLAGVTAAVTGTLPAGSVLVHNSRWAFACGRVAGIGNEAGYYGSNPLYDATFTRLSLAGSGGFAVSTDFTRVATYPGGPGLPLLNSTGSGGACALFAAKADQFVGGSGALKRMTLVSQGRSPNVVLGGSLGGLEVRDCLLTGGTRAFSHARMAVFYPTLIEGCVLAQHDDCHVHLTEQAHLYIGNCHALYGGRRDMMLDTVTGKIESIFSTSTTSANFALVGQFGGCVTYEDYHGDDEDAFVPPLLRLVPSSLQNNAWKTTAKVLNSFSSADPTKGGVVVDAATPGYTGAVRLVMDDGNGFLGPLTNYYGPGLVATRDGVAVPVA